MTTTVVNNSIFRSLFEKQLLTGNNFMEWYRNLRIVLSTEDKLSFLEQQILTLPVPPAGQTNPLDVVTTHQAWVMAHKEIDGLMLMTMDPDIQKNLEHLGAYDMLKELKTLYVQQEDQELLQTVQEFHMCKQEEGHLILVSLRKEYDGFVQNYNIHSMGKTGLRGSRKLKPGALSLYVDDGHRPTVDAIREFHLCLPSGLVLILHNCHSAPSITRGIISVSRLYKDGFVNRFENDNSISVSKNNLIYFNAIPRDNIYEIVMYFSNTNDSSMFAVTNKIAKLNLDSALLWHCRLGHINKKRIEKFQHDRLLDSTDIKSFEKYVACMSGKMAIKPYSHQVEGAKDLLRLIHTDVCGPFKIMSRQGASYFVTFTDDFSRYGYVYLLKHKHEVFETFKVFQKEVENQLGKTIRSLRSDRGGCPKETMRYSFYYPPENKVFVAQNAKFFENDVIDHEASGSLEDLKIIQEEDTHPSLDTSLNHDEDDQEIDEPQSDINPICRDLGEPANYKAVLLDPESDKWLNDMNVEMQSMKDNEVWELVDLPPDGKTISHKWLFKKKTNMNGAVHTYKARLVAKGFTQTLGIDYEETFSPVADIRAIRILIATSAFYDYEIWQMDVKTAFLNRYLNKEVYMEKPEGFVSQKYPNRVCKLKRSIYGLKQASRQWNKRFDDEIKKFRFSQNRDEPCVYVKASRSYVTFLILYVNDILIMGNNILMLQDVKSYLGRCFAMKDLGEAAYILGIKIYRNRSKRLIGLCQSGYIEKILKRFYIENSKRWNDPNNPCDAHWTAVKNILKYLCNTKDMFLVSKHKAKYDAEYIAAFDASKEAVWICKFTSRLGVVPTTKKPINMYCDNTGAIAIAKGHGVTKDHEASGSLKDLEIIQEEDTYPSLDTSLNRNEDDQEINEPQSDINPIHRSTRTRRASDRMCLYVDAEEHELGDLDEPVNYKAALLDPKSGKWLNVMNVEMQSMKDNKVWELVDLPPDGKTVGHKWLFKKKTDMDEVVHTYKACLVAKGFTQTPGIDYEEIFSPIADIRAIRILIVIAAFYDYEIWQTDVKTAFLNGYLNEENPGDAHWTAVKNILKYLRNTKDMFLVYGGDMKRELRVSCYTDAGYLTDADDMKS
ncbi:retrotransposon protein, putative, ty1-copia subclass [Tanacetum coccineum]